MLLSELEILSKLISDYVMYGLDSELLQPYKSCLQ